MKPIRCLLGLHGWETVRLTRYVIVSRCPGCHKNYRIWMDYYRIFTAVSKEPWPALLLGDNIPHEVGVSLAGDKYTHECEQEWTNDADGRDWLLPCRHPEHEKEES